MHGQMRPAEKQEAMARFAAGGAQVLVATTVIEVGIDVPNATVMLVEDADRYGISQLHQLRGRIGRGEHASLCLLFGRRDSRRLQALAARVRRLRAGRGRPRAARPGRAGRHAPVRARHAVSVRASSRGRRAAGARAALSAVIDCSIRISRARARAARAMRCRALRRRASADPGLSVRVRRRHIPGARRCERQRGEQARARPPTACARRCSRSWPRSRGRARARPVRRVRRARDRGALARGGASATFVDSAAAAVAVIRRNLAELGLEAEVIQLPALRALACTPIADRQYDLVFLDPPYRLASSLGPELSRALPPVLADRAPGSWPRATAGHPLELELPLLRERRYGDTLIRIHGAR